MSKEKYFNRDLSWLSFNERVLMEANDTSVPLYERIKFLAIYSSNLDEFFRVRVAFIKRLILLDKEKLNSKAKLSSPKKLLREIISVVNKQQDLFGNIFKNTIIPELTVNKVHIYYAEPYAEEHLDAIEEMFFSKILSFIQPVVIPKNGKTPVFLENRRLYTITDLVKDGKKYLGIINIPSNEVSRFQKLPGSNGRIHYTFIDDIIRHFSHVIFSGFKVQSHSNVKLNRDAELFLSEDYSDDTAVKIKSALNNRKIGSPSRFLYEPGMHTETLKLLKKKLKLQDEDCISGGQYHNMDDLFALPNPIGARLENIPLPPLPHKGFHKGASIFNAIDKKDILLSFPYQKYDYILRLFNEAAIDPNVTSIKATLYRVARDSHITNALISAALNRKKVIVLVEAKARFDEENNLEWSRKMKEAGVQVVHSRQSIKVHSKVALITRKSANKSISKYAFLGTGNFNEKTAGIYTDYALLTSDPRLTNELDNTLAFTLGKRKKVSLKHLLVAQVNMPEQFSKLIDNEVKAATAGRKGRVILKINNLQDKKMIKKLYQAASKGVQVDLIVRGICCLVPGNNIRLIRIVDRYLEHARIYIFHNGGDEKIYIGSADWMERNLYRRIEVVFPIYDASIRSLICKNVQLQLDDNTKGVAITDKLENIKVSTNGNSVRAQYDFYEYLDGHTL